MIEVITSGSNLRTARKAKGFTLKQLAELSGVHYVKIQQIEAGKIDIRNITLQNGLRLAHALGVRPEDLIPIG